MIKIKTQTWTHHVLKAEATWVLQPRYWTVKQLSATFDCIHPTFPLRDPPNRGLEKERPTGQTFGGV